MEPRELLCGRTGAGRSTQDAYNTKLDGLVATIEAIAPDVLAVQEVVQPDALEDLRAAHKR